MLLFLFQDINYTLSLGGKLYIDSTYKGMSSHYCRSCLFYDTSDSLNLFRFFECKYGHINTEWYPRPSILLSDLHLFLSTDQEPWPSCAEFDEQGIAYVCVIFYNTTFSATQVSGCVKLNVLVETEIIIPLKCFTLPRPKAIAIDNKSQAVMARK